MHISFIIIDKSIDENVQQEITFYTKKTQYS